MWPRFQLLPLMLFAVLLSGCAGLQPGYDAPTLEVTGVRLDPEAASGMPRFLIGLRVINPNRRALQLDGVSYNLYLQNQRVLSGVSSKIPQVAGYSDRNFEVAASPALFGSMRLLVDLMNQPQLDALEYRVEAKLDGGGLQWPVRVEDRGRLSLGPTAR
ncbi:LEA type 2 family protein [Marinobacterium weihaiense]|uniref:LEA type 2 family protein n=1 Tax=Marinobacterium weihaiense TaxID=2851016 RepID=A0ABS6M813_9GAMM|nr:LEA type 2 family protein [Marinobacterium weihaiense]MBV0932423.1 LEA type 2 family protein [Marinobacterium weihaiense]